ncbi:hypothetical protein KY290_011050 [Solanum tuberosum]|uniref:Retrovirus-related Pol polyprotein from transposon TNT 1-94-like beta-barrel domain-containing protein n=1 Tax=Solanum tuberosum TaxID=4113 RepID=A0ABQ7VZJ4_SOLTU|nr:hypothetical protein KY290_011050 [Solanum tuberosum]
MASENFVQAAIPRFDGHYDHWSMLMENFLRSKDIGKWLWLAYQNQQKAHQCQTHKEQKHKQQNTSKQIWDSMKKKYQVSTRAKRQQLQALRSKFETLQMKSGESVMDYFSWVMTVVNKMRIHGDKSNEVTIVENILRTMTPKFNFDVCSIEESHDIDFLSVDEFQSSLLILEQKIIKQEKEEVALNASTDDRSTGQGYNRGNGRGRGKDFSKVRGEESNFAKQEEEEISLLMVFNMKGETNKNLWYLDSGCSNHMSGDKSVFSALDESFRDSVKFGYNSKVAAMGKGQI